MTVYVVERSYFSPFDGKQCGTANPRVFKEREPALASIANTVDVHKRDYSACVKESTEAEVYRVWLEYPNPDHGPMLVRLIECDLQ
jgi:hypothetical protein